MTVKMIGYLVMLAGVIALAIGLVLIVHSHPYQAILIGLGAIFAGAGYYIAKKQPALPGVK